MRNTFIFLCLFLFFSILVNAQQINDTIPSDDYPELNNDSDSIPVPISVQEVLGVDSLLLVESDPLPLITEYPDTFYTNRLQKIPSLIELNYNEIVKRFIEVYTVKKRDKMEEILALKDYYFPIFEEILDSYGLPTELKYLAVVESALNPRAMSRVGATGIWQFMYATGRMYKLTINSFVDQRRDPIAATHAAAKYFMDMYKIYNDWNLVIASYNCGPGNVNKAIRRSGGKTNYWDIYYYLPRETRGYVPLYVAATYAMHYHKDHNIFPRKMDVLPICDTIMVSQNIHLQQVAGILNLPLQQLRDYNPQYRRDIIPGAYSACPLRLPVEYAPKYIDNEKLIAEYRRNELFSGEFKIINPANYQSGRYTPEPPSGNMQKIYYTVHTGDNLGGIAGKYRVRISDLRYWNNINRNMIRSGQKLVVYVPKSKAASYAQNSKVAEPINSTTSGDFIYYQVKEGDTLWNIASQYSGVTDNDLRAWNNIAEGNSIKPGQTIRIKRMN